ncbi:MAG: LacI family DNA-binding transcriptional regulator [Chloroflexi bacterium]|nr:LacI family DNA-binding transcriptional regulator [Chloroflexota bacterium]
MPDATVYDVAKKAKVSIATVSRVLNSPEKVQASTRKRVLAAIDALGFVPRAEAVARARKSQGRIGLLAPFLTYPSFAQRLRGISAALSASPYELVIYNIDSSARRDGYLNSISVTRRLDGLIIMSFLFDDHTARRLVQHGLETVLIESSRDVFSSIEIDDEAGGRIAAEYLLSKGHTRCAFIGDTDLPDYAIPVCQKRLTGYRHALRAAGTALPEEYVALAPIGMEQARQQAHCLLNLPHPPTAIFCYSDLQAMGVLKAARERGVAVPGQLAVMGFDDLDVADYIGLTTIRQPLEESGRVAVELLLARLTDRTRPVQHVKLPLTVIPRETA